MLADPAPVGVPWLTAANWISAGTLVRNRAPDVAVEKALRGAPGARRVGRPRPPAIIALRRSIRGAASDRDPDGLYAPRDRRSA